MCKNKRRIAGKVIAFILAVAVVLPILSPIKVNANSLFILLNGITVQEKMDQLLDKLGVTSGKTVYFTKTQDACTTNRELHVKCSKCSMGQIAQEKWFKNLFGDVSVSLFPSHDVDATRRDYSGQSCFGFACFAQWYLYADSSAENLVGKRVATIKFNKDEIINNVKPGDVLRIASEVSHSALVYSVDENGVTVIDSNWNMGGQLNCVVQKHFIPWDASSCAGYTTYVNRVTKTADIPAGMAGMFDVKPKIMDEKPVEPEEPETNKQYGTLDLSSTTWTSYNVGLDVEMKADKAYPLKHGAEFEILGKYTNSKGKEIYHVYSVDLGMDCYVTAKYVKVEMSQVETTDKEVTTDNTDNTDNENKETGWIKDLMNRWFFVNPETGNKEKGWLCDAKSKLWYYLGREDGCMLSDSWFCDPESGRWYYLDENGAMCTGWIKVDGKQYYLDKNGAMCTGWNMLDGIWYLLGGDGAILTGWQKVGDKQYYLTEEGKCLINTTTPDGYKVDGTGARME